MKHATRSTSLYTKCRLVCTLRAWFGMPSPHEPMIHRERALIIVQMPNIAEHSCRHKSAWSQDKIGNTTIENGHSQPCLGWQLQASTEEVSDDVSMTNNNFEFVAIFWSLRPSEDMRFENPLYASPTFVDFFHSVGIV